MKKHKIHLIIYSEAITESNTIKTQCGKIETSTKLLTTPLIEETTCLKCQQGYQLAQPTTHYLKPERDTQRESESACGKSRSNLTMKVDVVNCRGCKRTNSYRTALKKPYKIDKSGLIPILKLSTVINEKE